MPGLWYFIIMAPLTAGTFFGLWLSEMVLRREWNHLRRSRRTVNEAKLELEQMWEEWRQLQDMTQRRRHPEDDL